MALETGLWQVPWVESVPVRYGLSVKVLVSSEPSCHLPSDTEWEGILPSSHILENNCSFGVSFYLWTFPFFQQLQMLTKESHEGIVRPSKGLLPAPNRPTNQHLGSFYFLECIIH